jgi:hypothetical protein
LADGVPCARLRGALVHLNYRDLKSHLRTIDSYATHFARHAFEVGKRVTVFDAPVRSLLVLGKSLIVKLGFLDGGRGVLAAGLAAYSTWLKYWRAFRWRRRGGAAA